MASPVQNSGSASIIVAAEKRGDVLRWLLRFDFSDRHALAEVLRLKRSGAYSTIQKMISAGLLGETRVIGCPVPVIHLRKPGLEAAQRLMAGTEDETMTAPVHPSKINCGHVQHDLLVQRFVLHLRHINEKPLLVLSEKQIQARHLILGRDEPLTSTKVPDAIVYLHGLNGDPEPWAVEVQQTSEDHDLAERKLSQYAESINSGEINGLVYVSTTPSITDRIEKIARGPVRRWWYNRQHKHWYPYEYESGEDPVTAEMITKQMMFVALPHLEKQYYQYAVR